MVILGFVPSGTTMDVISELVDPQGNQVAQGLEKFPLVSQSRCKEDAVISSMSVGIHFKPDSALGFYTSRFRLNTKTGESFTGGIEFLLQE